MRRRDLLAAMLGVAGAAGMTGSAAAQVVAPRRKLVGLSIGIDGYSHLNPLATAAADAAAVAEQLARIGYDFTMAPPTAKSEQVFDAVQQFYATLEPEATVFVFLAGHGVQVSGRNYFLPADTPPLDDLDALSGAFVIDSLLGELSKYRPAQSVIMLDACRTPTLGNNLEGYAPGFASTVAPRDFMIAYSAGYREFALDQLGPADPSPNGLFTRNLLPELAANRSIYSIVGATRSRVIPQADAIKHDQHPALYDQSHRTFWLDGIAREEAEPVPQVGSLEGARFIIASSADYSCFGTTLRSAKSDTEKLYVALTELGATVQVYASPTKEELLEACSSAGTSNATQFGFVWIGLGRMERLQAAGIIERDLCSRIIDGKEDGAAIDLVTHSDLIEAFRSGYEGPGKPAPLSLFFNVGLSRADDLVQTGEYSSGVDINDLGDSYLIPPMYHNVALLTAAGYDQQLMAGSESLVSTPFISALINAMSHPGLPVRALADQVKAEVETMTNNAQSPQLFASREAEERALVEGRPVSAGTA